MICGCQDEHSCECPAAWAGDRNATTPAVIRALEKRVEELEAQLKAERAAVWKLIDESRQQQAHIAELEAELSQSMGDHVETGRALRLERAENARLREALEIIAGKLQCVDNLMGNVEIAAAALLGDGDE
jgi:predicted RNase H-like nuclease (RuvC/YqgF family)